ncbi:hypothetical protein ACFLZB_02755 [Nanoarchaeota archaeon]
MNFREAFEKLQGSLEFKEWRKENPSPFLAHFFIQLDSNYNRGEWEIGFYNKEKDRITTFVVGSSILVKPEDEVFKKEEHEVRELKIDEIEVGLDEVIKTFKQYQEEKYPGQVPMKLFAILQDIAEGLVWNVTSATKTFSALNLKISVADGKIISEKCESFFDLRT